MLEIAAGVAILIEDYPEIHSLGLRALGIIFVVLVEVTLVLEFRSSCGGPKQLRQVMLALHV